MKHILAVLAFCGFVFNMPVYAQLPQTISYQGFLSTSGGLPASDTIRYLKFKFYDVLIGGAALWTETDTVPVHNGTFNVVLGKNTPLSTVNLNQQLYLGVTNGSDSEFLPARH